MSDQDENQESANLSQINEDLTGSLERCHELLAEYRGKMAANSNDEAGAEDGEAKRLG